jgi:uncharacterized membrane protein YccF (DUF307 family)
MQCPACGRINHAEWYFCTGCGGTLDMVRGVRQPTAATPPSAVQPAPPAPWPQHQPGSLQPPPPHQPVTSAPFQPSAQPVSGMAVLVHPAFQPVYGVAAPAQVNIYVQTHVVPAAPPAMLISAGGIPPILLRVVWFLCIGLWLGMLTTLVSWALIVSVLGLPLGVMLLNRLPMIMTLRPRRPQTRIEPYAGGYALQVGGPSQQPLLVRGIYFLAVGWWLSALWLLAAWGIAGLTFGLGLPLAFWMFNRVGAVTTLVRH